MIKIENQQLAVEIDETGAQLTHIFNKQADFDYIWNGDLWPKHAPVLFPAIGRSNEDSYLINGQNFEMPQHGFVSAYDFTVVNQKADTVSLQLIDNEETYKLYPYHFKLTITFTLKASQLALNFEVNNLNDESLSFSLGSHPAFNVPIAGEGTFDDYELTFDTPTDKIETFEIIKTPNPYRSGKTGVLTGVQNKKLALNHALFEKGLIILKTPVNQVKLGSQKSAHSVTLNMSDFNYFTLWTKEGANAPFLCLEPFYGLPDVSGELRELATKEGNYHVAANEKAAIGYTMTLD